MDYREILSSYPIQIQFEYREFCDVCGLKVIKKSEFMINNVTEKILDTVIKHNHFSLTYKRFKYNIVYFATQRNVYHKSCNDKKIYLDQFRNKEMDDYIFSHGVGYLGFCGVEDGIKLIINNLGKVQLSTASQNIHIGHMGLYLKGNVLSAFKSDMCTSYDALTMRRYIILERELEEENFRDSYINHYNEYVLKNEEEFNDEIILVPKEIMGIWVKEYASQQVKDFANKIANDLSLPLSYKVEKSWMEKYKEDLL